MKISKLPALLQEAQDHKAGYRNKNNRQFLRHRWQNFVSRACKEIPELHYDQSTELLSLGRISPGCELCRSGQWDCFFVTPKCNLNCDFCLSQVDPSEYFQGSNWGNDLQKNINYYHSFGIQGISFSGGEPLLKQKDLINWVEMCHKDPNMTHIWLYTNGLLLNQEVLETLAQSGLDEIRVNAAAKGYQHPHVMEMLHLASTYFNWVTVEIPLIPDQTGQLLKAIPLWVDRGVQILNMHELLFEPGSNAEKLTGKRIDIHLPDGHQTAISPESNTIALQVFSAVIRNNIPISVNYCSTVGKWRQLTARREVLIADIKQPYETYLGDGVLESYFTIENGQVEPIPSQMVEDMQKTQKSQSIYHLQRMVPLALKEEKNNWILFEVLS